MANITGTNDDVLIGTSGDDVIDSGDGNDRLVPGQGNDTALAGAGNDVIVSTTTFGESPGNNTYDGGSGVDSVSYIFEGSGRTVDLGAGTSTSSAGSDQLISIENVGGTFSADTLTGDGSDNLLYGDAGADTLFGLGGNDSLVGGTGANTLIGGQGNDLYVLENTSTTITELADEGVDTILVEGSSISGGIIDLSTVANIENYQVVHRINATLTLYANSESNLINTGVADFTSALIIYGTGGANSESYVVHAGAGDDVVTNLSMNNESIASFYGDAGNDLLTVSGSLASNYLDGGDGNDTLFGGDGDDTLVGGAGQNSYAGGGGNDTYYITSPADVTVTEHAGGGNDTIVASNNVFILPDNVEDLTFSGTSAFTGMGSGLSNTIMGGISNDVLNGQGGADRLIGGEGDDRYSVDNVGDVIVEMASEGTDEVATSLASYVLQPNLENLRFVGVGDFVGTGNSAANVITGGAGNNKLDGGTGADVLTGGAGDDTYYVDDIGDVIAENSNEGADTVHTALDSYALGANVENLIFDGVGNFVATGNGLANNITGGAGDDTISGGGGVDHLSGGVGNDTFVFYAPTEIANGEIIDGGPGCDDGSIGGDTLSVSGDGHWDFRTIILSSIERASLTGTAGGELDFNFSQFGGGDSADNGIYVGPIVTVNGGKWDINVFMDSPGTFSEGGWDIHFTGAQGALTTYITGSSGDDMLFGSTQRNIIDGGAGDDVLAGSSFVADVIDGGDGNDLINGGGAGADMLSGGPGDDTYFVDNTGVTIIENPNEGIDTVITKLNSFVLAANVENLVFNNEVNFGGVGNFVGTGNALNNTISGGAGNYTLDGGAGGDTLIGGLGVDTFSGLRAEMAGDTFADLSVGDRADVTDVAPGALSFTYIGGVLSLGAGASVTVAGSPVGRFVRADDGVGGTYLHFVQQSQHANDFNHDGLADLLWRLSTGETAMWTLNGSGGVLGGFGIATPGLAWTLTEQADFTGDGRVDLLWRETSTGALTLYAGSDTGVGAPQSVMNPGPNFTLVGAGDFNADNHGDLIWRAVNGDLSTWIMNGANVLSQSAPQALANSWRVVGVADFDGDGKTDFLFRNTNGNHDIALWEMDGGTVKAGLGIVNPGPAWQIVGAGDFNNDGLVDILFRNAGTGDVAVWEMNGNSIIAGLGINNPGPNWTIANVNDYNGDGYSDIFWRNPGSGDLAVWLLHDNQILAGIGIPHPNGPWAPADHGFDVV